MQLYLYASNSATLVAGATECLEQFLQFTANHGAIEVANFISTVLRQASSDFCQLTNFPLFLAQPNAGLVFEKMARSTLYQLFLSLTP